MHFSKESEVFVLKQKLFSKKEYPECCENCQNGKLTADKNSVLCVKSGVMMPDYKCDKYKYDPLKRRPAGKPGLEKHAPEEFKL